MVLLSFNALYRLAPVKNFLVPILRSDLLTNHSSLFHTHVESKDH